MELLLLLKQRNTLLTTTAFNWQANLNYLETLFRFFFWGWRLLQLLWLSVGNREKEIKLDQRVLITLKKTSKRLNTFDDSCKML